MYAGWDKSICIIFFSEYPLDKFLSPNQERGGVDACWLGAEQSSLALQAAPSHHISLQIDATQKTATYHIRKHKIHKLRQKNVKLQTASHHISLQMEATQKTGKNHTFKMITQNIKTWTASIQ